METENMKIMETENLKIRDTENLKIRETTPPPPPPPIDVVFNFSLFYVTVHMIIIIN